MSNLTQPSIPHSPTPSLISKPYEPSSSTSSSKIKQPLPAITTQPPSRNTTFHPQSQTHSHSHSTSRSPFLPSSTTVSTHPLLSHETTDSTIRPTSAIEGKLRPSSFAPFFTLINDVKENEQESGTYHPSRVHYIFSDDEENADLLSAALIRTISPASNVPRESGELQEVGTNTTTTTSSSSSSGALKTQRKKSLPEKGKEKETREERVIIVDITTTPSSSPGLSIQKISSLSKDWQILSATLDNAPTWDGGISPSNPESNSLMLNISGVSIPAISSSLSYPSSTESSKLKGKGGEGGEESGSRGAEGEGHGSFTEGAEMQGLLEVFDRKMEVLRKVVGQSQDLGVETALGLDDEHLGLGIGEGQPGDLEGGSEIGKRAVVAGGGEEGGL